MRKLILLASVCVALSATGCATSGVASIAEQLKNDRAKVQLDIGTIYGTVHFVRDGTGNTNVDAPALPVLPPVSTNSPAQ